MSKKAVLLINLGTPDSTTPAAIRRYLSQFLNDPRVIDLPFYIRWPFVNLFLVPFRYRRIAKAYQKIWLPTGSPLFIYSQEVKEKLADQLGESYQVELGMRYGNPSIESALSHFTWDQLQSLSIIPLFPQYASASTGSALEVTFNWLKAKWNQPQLKVINDFYAHPGYISAYAATISQAIENTNIELLLFSYHGLPERHITKSHCHAVCDRLSSCPPVEKNNLFCYRAQCYATSRLLAKAIGYQDNQYLVSFQSRLGRTPWIKPYTDLLLSDLIQKGVKRIAVVSPSFVMDCLETVEEINIRLREQWMNLGGETFVFVPCVNASSIFVNALAEMV